MHLMSVMTGLTLEGHPGLAESINYFVDGKRMLDEDDSAVGYVGAQIEKAQDVGEWCVRQWRYQGMVCWWRRL
ncbi:hypothetical protein M405DRAFT_814641 [Rhizopogon salebrosus TDB-379]|nr:hypothetical protein M405DRAFT_814641 [Rhizopogon salebrosus TDB-379]